MTTEQDLTLLSAYLDNELEGEQLTALRERLLQEPALRRELDALKGTDSLLHDFAARIDGRPLPQAVHGMVAGSARSSAAKLFGVAAAVFVVTMSTFIMMPKQDDLAFLNAMASGEIRHTEIGSVQVIATFKQHDGKHCREYVVPGQHAVACLASGRWQNIVTAEVQVMPEGAFIPASPNVPETIDRYVRLNMSGDVIQGDDEAALISAEWH
ncbi:MAG: hypothetical protein VW840_00665 [Gammaproteobacteria bacterium]